MTSLNLNEIDALIPSIQSTVEDFPSTPIPDLSEDITNYSLKNVITSESEQEQQPINADPRIVALGLQGKLTSLENQNLTSDEWNAIYNRNRFVYEHEAAALSELDAQTHQLINPYDAYANDDRSLLSQGRDIVLGAGQGIVDSVLGTAALGASLIGANSLATGLAKTSQTVKEMSSELLGSEYMNRARRGNAALTGARDILSERNYQKNIDNGDSPVLAHLKQIGHDVANWGIHTWNDSNAFESLTANAIGSLLTAGGISSKLSKLGTLLTNSSKSPLGRAIGARLATTESRTFLQRVIGNEGITNAILESGGSFLSAANTVENMSQEELMSSPDFQADVEKYMQQGFSFDEAFQKAKTDTAASVGRIASLITVPIAATTGAIAHDVIRNPLAPFRKGTFKGNPLTQFVKASGKAGLEEMTEESLQGTQQYGENLGLNLNGIETPMWKGVGQNIVEGAMAGFASGGMGPGLGLAGKTLKATSSSIYKSIRDRNITQEKALQRTAEEIDKGNAALQQDLDTSLDTEPLRKITPPPDIPLNENSETSVKAHNEWRNANGFPTVGEEKIFDNASPEEKQKLLKEQKYQNWVKYNLFKHLKENTDVSVDDLEIPEKLNHNDPNLVQALKSYTGNETVQDTTKEILEDTKVPFYQRLQNLKKRAEEEITKGHNETAIRLLLDGLALAKYTENTLNKASKIFNDSVLNVLNGISPELTELLKNPPQNEEQQKTFQKTLEKLKTDQPGLYDLYGFITKYVFPYQWLNQAKEKIYSPFGDIVSIANKVPELYQKDKSLQNWVNERRTNEESLKDEDKPMFYLLDSISLAMSNLDLDQINNQIGNQTNQDIQGKIQHYLDKDTILSEDPEINNTLKQFYTVAAALLTTSRQFLQNNPSLDAEGIDKIHQELTNEHLETVTGKKGFGVAITEHMLRAQQAFNTVAQLRAQIQFKTDSQRQVTDLDKKEYKLAQDNLTKSLEDIYNFAWSQRNKLYALKASLALSKHNWHNQNNQIPSEAQDLGSVYYNSFGYSKNGKVTYWSEQGSPTEKKSVFYNDSRKNTNSQRLQQAVDLELNFLTTLANIFADSAKSFLPHVDFSALSKGLTLRAEAQSAQFRSIPRGQEQQLYQTFSELAKQPAPKLVQTTEGKPQTLAPSQVDSQGSFQQIAQEALSLRNANDIDLSKFTLAKYHNFEALIYNHDNNETKVVLYKQGQTWVTPPENSDLTNQIEYKNEHAKTINDFVNKLKEKNSNPKPDESTKTIDTTKLDIIDSKSLEKIQEGVKTESLAKTISDQDNVEQIRQVFNDAGFTFLSNGNLSEEQQNILNNYITQRLQNNPNPNPQFSASIIQQAQDHIEKYHPELKGKIQIKEKTDFGQNSKATARTVYEEKTIYLHPDEAKWQEKFDNKAWTKPTLEGVVPLGFDFQSVQDYKLFVIEHEIQHWIQYENDPEYVKNLTSEQKPNNENKINQNAIKFLKEHNLLNIVDKNNNIEQIKQNFEKFQEEYKNLSLNDKINKIKEFFDSLANIDSKFIGSFIKQFLTKQKDNFTSINELKTLDSYISKYEQWLSTSGRDPVVLQDLTNLYTEITKKLEQNNKTQQINFDELAKISPERHHEIKEKRDVDNVYPFDENLTSEEKEIFKKAGFNFDESGFISPEQLQQYLDYEPQPKTNTINLKELDKISIKRHEHLRDTAINAQSPFKNFLENNEIELFKKAGFIFLDNGNLSKEQTQQYLDYIAQQKNEKPVEQQIKDIITQQINNYIKNNAEKVIFYEGKHTKLSERKQQSPEFIKKFNNYIYDNFRDQLHLLTNPRYIEALLLDFLDQENKIQDKISISFSNTSYEVMRDIINVLASIPVNTEKLSKSIHKYLLKKGKDNTTITDIPILAYFAQQWNEEQTFNSRIEMLNKIRETAEQFILETASERLTNIPEDIQPIFAEFQAQIQNIYGQNNQLFKNENFDKITLETLFRPDLIQDPVLKAKIETYRLALTSLFNSATSFQTKNLLNYTKNPVRFLEKLITLLGTSSKSTQIKQQLSLHNKHIKNLESILNGLKAEHSSATQVNGTINSALNYLLFDVKNRNQSTKSLLHKLYDFLEQRYQQIYSDEVQNHSTDFFITSLTSGLFSLMQNQEFKEEENEDGTVQETNIDVSKTNRLPWITLNAEGKPILNKHLIEKALIGTISALIQNPTNLDNYNKELDDIDKEIPLANQGIKAKIASYTNASNMLDLIKRAIRQYTDLRFNQDIDMYTEERIISALAVDILSFLDQEGILTSHTFSFAKEKDGTDWTEFKEWTEYNMLERQAYIDQAENEGKTVYFPLYYEFNPSVSEFYTHKEQEISNLKKYIEQLKQKQDQTKEDKEYLKNLNLELERIQQNYKDNQAILRSFDILYSYAPTLIDTLLLPEINNNILIGSEGQHSIDQYQLHTDVPLTESEKENLRDRQNQEFFLNKQMFSIVKGMQQLTTEQGDSYIDVFLGREDLTKDNKGVLDNVKASLEGRKLATLTSISNMQALVKRMLSQLDPNEVKNKLTDLSQLSIRFKYNVQRMGRLMMTGFNPQSDKMFRELFLPFAKPVDLTDSTALNVFYRAVAQSLGSKVQYILSGVDYFLLDEVGSISDGNIKETQKLAKELNKIFELKDSLKKDKKDTRTSFLELDEVKKFQELITSNDFTNIQNADALTEFNESAFNTEQKEILKNFIDVARKQFGSDCTWVGLHGLIEYLRYDAYKTNSKQLKNFNTQLYLEADGIASGASNSIFLFSTFSEYDEDSYLEYKEKKYTSVGDYTRYKYMLRAGGGIGITGSFGSSMQQTDQAKNDDLYGSTAKGIKRTLQNVLEDPESKTLFTIKIKTDSEKSVKYVKDFSEKVLTSLNQQLQENNIKSTIFRKSKTDQTKTNSVLQKQNISDTESILTTSTKDYLVNFLNLYASLVPAVQFGSLQKLEEQFVIGRNFLKSPITKYGYGAGVLSIARGLVQGNNLYPGIINMLERRMTEYNLSQGKERKKLAKELKEIITRIRYATAFKVNKITNSDGTISYTGEYSGTFPNSIKNLNAAYNAISNLKDVKLDFNIDPEIFDTLVTNTQAIFSETMSDVITKEMYGEEFVQNKQLLLSLNNLMAMSYSTVYMDRILQEADKANSDPSSKQRKFITTKQYKQIERELRQAGLVPEYTHDLFINSSDTDIQEQLLTSNFRALKETYGKKIRERFKGSELVSKSLSMKLQSVFYQPTNGKLNKIFSENYNKYHNYESSLNIRLPVDSGVMILPQTVINMTESSIMKIMTIQHLAGLDVYDGFNMLLQQVLALSYQGSLSSVAEKANKAVFDVWMQANVFRTIGRTLDNFYNALYGTNSEGTSYSELLHSNLFTPLDSKNLNLTPLQDTFIKNMASLCKALEVLHPEALNTIFSGENIIYEGQEEISSHKFLTNNLLPFSDEDRNNTHKTERIKKLLVLGRYALLQAEQKIAIKQTIMNNIVDVSVDQMGASAKPYFHKGHDYNYLSKYATERTIGRIRSFKEYKKDNPEATYKDYIAHEFNDKYKKAFRLLQTDAQQFDLAHMALSNPNNILSFLANNQKDSEDEAVVDFLAQLLFHQEFNDNLENTIQTINAQELANRVSQETANVSNPEKQIKTYTAYSLIRHMKEDLKTLNLPATERAVYTNLLNMFEKDLTTLFKGVRILEPSAQYMQYFLNNIQNKEVRELFQNYLNKQKLHIGWFNIQNASQENPDLFYLDNDAKTALAKYDQSPKGRFITLFTQNINNEIEPLQQRFLALLHELSHAYLVNYMQTNLQFVDNDNIFQLTETAKKNLSQVEQTALNHIVDMYKQYIQATGLKKTFATFHEFLAISATYDKTARYATKRSNKFEVKGEKTLLYKLQKNFSEIFSEVVKSLGKLFAKIFKFEGSRRVENLVSDVFFETHQAISILSQNPNFYLQSFNVQSRRQNIESFIDTVQANLDYTQMAQDEMEVFKQIAEGERVIEDNLAQDYPTEFTLINDDGTKNLQQNNYLESLSNFFKLDPEQSRTFTKQAKEIFALLVRNPSLLTEPIEALRQFYKQLTPTLLSTLTSEVQGDVATIQQLTEDLQNAFQELTKYDTITAIKLIKSNKQNFAMAIPVIIALNNVSPAMQTLTSKMVYSDIRTKNEKSDLNQRIRDIAHNIYESIYGHKNEQNVNQQLQTIRDEVDVDHTLRILDFLPSINPVLNIIDDKSNQIINNGLTYISEKYKGKLLNIIPYILRATSQAHVRSIEEMMLSLASDNVFYNTVSSLLNEMLPSSNFKKAFYHLRKLVKAHLDQERQDYRTIMPNLIRNYFTNQYSSEQWKSLSRSLAHTDLSVLSEEDRNIVFDLIKNQGKQALDIDVQNRYMNLLTLLNTVKPQIKDNHIPLATHWLRDEYIKPLAEYLATNHIYSQKHFYKNAFTICTEMLGDWFINNIDGKEQQEILKQTDELISLQSLLLLSDSDFETFNNVLQNDLEATNKVLNQIQEFKRNEDKKIDLHTYDGKKAKLNAWKGYLPTTVMAGTSITLGRKSNKDYLESIGYAQIKQANTVGTDLDQVRYFDENGNEKQHTDELYYFYSSMPRRSAFNEGSLSIVLSSFYGNNLLTSHVDSDPRFTPIGQIIDEAFHYAPSLDRINSDGIAMVPVFNYNHGTLVTESYDLFINDDEVINHLEYQDTLPEMMGFWAGRQREEQVATGYNMTCLNLILKSFDPRKKHQYVNIMDPKQLNKVQRDAVSQIPWNIRVLGSQMFEEKFGEKGIWIRKDILKDTIGQRSASVMDLYNGITNLKPEHALMITQALKALCGNKAYNIAVGTEQAIQGLVSIARNFIVIKSCKVMMLNNFGNIWQLMAQGVPFAFIMRQIPKLLKESETYAQYGFEYQKLIVDRDTTNDPKKKKQIQAQLEMLENQIKSLSIAPILSEFSTINDLGMDTEDLELMRGAVASWVTKQVNKLPNNIVVAGKHILMTKDTAIYQFLEKATQYGDFIAKGILYNYMTKVQKKGHEEARYRVLDEFVNYDMLAGRTRSYLESMGLLWFYNYKLRIMKTAAKMIAEHPFRAMLVAFTPQWSPVGDAGDVLSDSLLGKLISGDLGFTIGPGMLFRGLTMHPLLELLF